MTFWVEEGPSDAVLFPADGPYDRRLGYVDLPGFIDSLERQGYAIESQARISDQFAWYFGRTGIAPYREKTVAGLTLLDRDGHPYFRSRTPARSFESSEAIPPMLVNSSQQRSVGKEWGSTGHSRCW